MILLLIGLSFCAVLAIVSNTIFLWLRLRRLERLVYDQDRDIEELWSNAFPDEESNVIPFNPVRPAS